MTQRNDTDVKQAVTKVLTDAGNEVAKRFDKDEPKQAEFKQMRESRPEVATSMKDIPNERSGQLFKPAVPDLVGPSRGKSGGIV